jgi:hypothetical protein
MRFSLGVLIDGNVDQKDLKMAVYNAVLPYSSEFVVIEFSEFTRTVVKNKNIKFGSYAKIGGLWNDKIRLNKKEITENNVYIDDSEPVSNMIKSIFGKNWNSLKDIKFKRRASGARLHMIDFQAMRSDKDIYKYGITVSPYLFDSMIIDGNWYDKFAFTSFRTMFLERKEFDNYWLVVVDCS